jgi:hypothetical protein
MHCSHEKFFYEINLLVLRVAISGADYRFTTYFPGHATKNYDI